MSRRQDIGEWVRSQRVGLILFGAVAMAFVTIAVLVSGPSPQQPYDARTSCVLEGEPAAHEIILIDTSDTLEPSHKQIIRAIVASEARAASAHEKITVATVDQSHPYDPRIVFSACAPRNAASTNWLNENPQIYGAIWRERFSGPLIVNAGAAADGATQHATPLIESIFGLTLRPDFDTAIASRKLVVVSDMLQNTPLYSHYRGTPSFAEFASRSGALQNVPDLKGVRVVSRYLIRPRSMMLQSAAQRRFWQDYFDAARADVHFEGWPWRELREWHQTVRQSATKRARKRHRTPHMAAPAG